MYESYNGDQYRAQFQQEVESSVGIALRAATGDAAQCAAAVGAVLKSGTFDFTKSYIGDDGVRDAAAFALESAGIPSDDCIAHALLCDAMIEHCIWLELLVKKRCDCHMLSPLIIDALRRGFVNAVLEHQTRTWLQYITSRLDAMSTRAD